MEGKICAVTGANAGLGYATAFSLAEKGAEVLMICRSKERGSIARQQIIEQTGNPAVHLILADFSSLEEVRRAGRYICGGWDRLHVLVNNAAAILSERRLSAEGYEMQLTVNHLAPFLLTHTLMPALLHADEARIINVSSNNHYRAEIHFNDVHLEKNYQVLRAYGQSKLANILFTYELDRRLKALGVHQVTVNAVDPGLNNTGIGLKNTNMLHRLAWWFRKQQGQTPEQGAVTQLHLATAPQLSGISGTYWADMRQKTSSDRSYHEAGAQKLWQMSLELCGLEGFFEENARKN